MIFNSLQYVAFLTVFVGVYWALPPRRRVPLLLAGSYYFYGSWDVRFLGLLVVSTATDYVVGRLLHAADTEAARRRLLLVSMVVNLGILGTFKYLGFFVESAADLLDSVGLSVNEPLLSIALPVGISFYTFQSMSYTIDVYRGQIEPCTDPVKFAAYVAYFPQLVAGPIERAFQLLPQIGDPDVHLTVERVQRGLLLIVVGLTKKIVIADQAATVANRVFAEPGQYTRAEVLAGVIAFALQIYGDFSGYTDIARGSSRLLGIELSVNFTEPYLSRSITEFWRRWHITLSNWLRDYLYVPLGGNRGGSAATYRNLMLTMLLGGLWHGAGWNFIIWGGLHGTGLAAHRWWSDRRAADRDAPPSTPAGRFAAVVATFGFVCVAWVFFRAPNAGAAFDVFGALVDPGAVSDRADLLLIAMLSGLTLLHDLCRRTARRTLEPIMASPALVGAVSMSMLVAVFVYSGTPAVPFIYFQF